MTTFETRSAMADRAMAELDRNLTSAEGWEVVDAAPAKVVFSARVPAEYSEPLAAEARRRGITPSALICEYVIDALTKVAEDTVITIRRGDLYRAIDRIVEAA